MKEQDKNQIKELNEMDISNLPDKEFKIVVIKILIGFEEWMNSVRTSRKKIENIKKNQMKNSVTKNTLEEISTRLENVEQIGNLESWKAG